jgi:hypothetical protein
MPFLTLPRCRDTRLHAHTRRSSAVHLPGYTSYRCHLARAYTSFPFMLFLALPLCLDTRLHAHTRRSPSCLFWRFLAAAIPYCTRIHVARLHAFFGASSLPRYHTARAYTSLPFMPFLTLPRCRDTRLHAHTRRSSAVHLPGYTSYRCHLARAYTSFPFMLFLALPLCLDTRLHAHTRRSPSCLFWRFLAAAIPYCTRIHVARLHAFFGASSLPRYHTARAYTSLPFMPFWRFLSASIPDCTRIHVAPDTAMLL